MQGTITLIGAGELAPGGARLHRTALGGLDDPRVVFLDTPAGFEANIDVIGARAAQFYRHHLRLGLEAAHYRHRERTASSDVAKAIAELRAADVIFSGPGSPTFAIAQWRGSPVWDAVVERFEAGARLLFASAAAITLGKYALPVYEVYKVGQDPHWVDGLDLLERLGLSVAVVPHYDDHSGGELYDSRFCFMGAERFDALLAQLPPDIAVLGIDGETAITLDPSTRTATVAGAGNVTIIGDRGPVSYGPGCAVPFEELRRSAQRAGSRKRPGGGPSVDTGAGPREPADGFEAVVSYVERLAALSEAERVELLARIEALRGSRAKERPAGDDALVDLVLELRAALREARSYDMADRARDALVELGYVITDTPEGTRWTRR